MMNIGSWYVCSYVILECGRGRMNSGYVSVCNDVILE